MSERLFESDKKPPLRLLVIRNGMPKHYNLKRASFEKYTAGEM